MHSLLKAFWYFEVTALVFNYVMLSVGLWLQLQAFEIGVQAQMFYNPAWALPDSTKCADTACEDANLSLYCFNDVYLLY